MIENIESQLDKWVEELNENENALAQAEGRMQTNLKRLKEDFKKKNKKEAREYQRELSLKIKDMKEGIEKNFIKLREKYDY